MPKKYTIIQYVSYFPPHTGGMESHAAQWADWRVKEGYGSCIIATYNIGQPVGVVSYETDSYTVVCIPAFEIIPTFPFPKFWTKRYWQAHKILRRYKADILITRTRFFMSSLCGGIFAKIHHIKRIHIEHGVDYVKMNARWKEIIAWVYDQLLGRLVFRMSDEVIAISQGCKQFARRFTSKDIPVIYRGVEFLPAERKRKVSETIALGFVGRLSALKGVDLILQACKQVVDKVDMPPFHLTLVGDGEERADLEHLVQTLGLHQYVTFLGYKNKDYLEQEFYLAMDICVNASRQEGLPTSVIEPLLSGCVVVATAVGGTPEITDKEDMLLVEPGNVDTLVAALGKAINEYATLSGLSKDHVRNTFDRAVNIEKYYDFFVSLEQIGK